MKCRDDEWRSALYLRMMLQRSPDMLNFSNSNFMPQGEFETFDEFSKVIL